MNWAENHNTPYFWRAAGKIQVLGQHHSKSIGFIHISKTQANKGNTRLVKAFFSAARARFSTLAAPLGSEPLSWKPTQFTNQNHNNKCWLCRHNLKM